MSYLIRIVAAVLIFGTNSKYSDAMSLECTFVTRLYDEIGEIYECDARVLFELRNIEDVTAVFGIHPIGKTNLDVQGLSIRAQDLQFIPTNVESFFPNLIAFNLVNNDISEISKRHLIPFPRLEFVGLYNNKITNLDSDTFSGMKSIKLIDFGSNNIKHVGHDFVLPDTGDIRFNSNPCVDLLAQNPKDIANLRFILLVNCPPTISQIENSLENRPNLLTSLRNENLQMETRLASLETMIFAQKATIGKYKNT